MANLQTRSIGDTSTVPASSSTGSGTNLFGKYELGKLLGCGASAKVYLARNLIHGHNVAMKAVSKNKVLKGGSMAQVKREISIMRQLHHPHTIKLYEVLATKTKIYFVMEFAKGGELFSKVAKGRFSEDLSRRYFRQLISAVSYCHSRGVFHRDLKLENVLIDENWDLKVTDFGLSAVVDQTRQDGLLHTLCGTPAYVAPEIFARKGYDGAKVDVWSCGVILYVLNAGYLPFNDCNLMAMYRKISKGQFRCPKWTSPDLKRLISRLLDTNPQTRITMDEILQDPWFTKLNLEKENAWFHKPPSEKEKQSNVGHGRYRSKWMNAFDLISISSGLDLSGLLGESDSVVERFVSSETPKKIIGVVELVGRADKVRMSKGDGYDGVKLEGDNDDFVIYVDIYQLTEKWVVVEVKKIGNENFGSSQSIWKDELRAKLLELSAAK